MIQDRQRTTYFANPAFDHLNIKIKFEKLFSVKGNKEYFQSVNE